MLSVAAAPAIASTSGLTLPRTTQQAKHAFSVSCSGKVKKRANRAIKMGSVNTGESKEMKSRTFIDSSGRPGTGKGVYQFSSKYGANVDGYSPIYAPGEWASKGDVYEPGATGLAIWAAGFALLLATGGYAIIATSAL
mmetsp:Transcript_13804/g.50269  ORF Transcript_13804/g.50269 Transcript_13804/m.50269 type:complete len:138 (-) Transcript_13804:128-541(-)